MGYSPRGHKESDTTERPSTSTRTAHSLSCHVQQGLWTLFKVQQRASDVAHGSTIYVLREKFIFSAVLCGLWNFSSLTRE